MKLFSRRARGAHTPSSSAIEAQDHVVTTLSGEGSSLTFEAKNVGDAPARFCIFMTPLEGFRGDLLTVQDAQGARMQYLGVQIKRSAPQDRHFVTLAPGETKAATFELHVEYGLTGVAPYRVQFKGNPDLNGLPDSNALAITPT